MVKIFPVLLDHCHIKMTSFRLSFSGVLPADLQRGGCLKPYVKEAPLKCRLVHQKVPPRSIKGFSEMLKRWAAWLFRLKISWKSALGAAVRGSPIGPRQRHPFIQTPSHHPLTLQKSQPFSDYSLCSWPSWQRIPSIFTLIKWLLLLVLFYLYSV